MSFAEECFKAQNPSDQSTMTAEGQSSERRVGRGAIWALAGRGLGVVATALMGAALPRFLTKEQYGAFSLIAVLAMFASVIGTLGLNDGCVRLLSEAAALKDVGRLRYILRMSLLLTISLATITGLIAAIWLVTLNPNIVALSTPMLLFLAVLGTVILLALQLVTAESLRGLHDIRIASMMSGGTGKNELSAKDTAAKAKGAWREAARFMTQSYSLRSMVIR
jgi:O-antigen/teichoic acid export membrane protein